MMQPMMRTFEKEKRKKRKKRKKREKAASRERAIWREAFTGQNASSHLCLWSASRCLVQAMVGTRGRSLVGSCVIAVVTNVRSFDGAAKEL